MVDSAYIPAIKTAVACNENAHPQPYILSFARLGKSGASFGMLQGDTHTNQLARDTLTAVLQTAEISSDDIEHIIASLSQALPHGNPLNGTQTALVNTALSSPPGKTLVDQMDQTLLSRVLAWVDDAISAAATRELSFAPVALLYIAVWVNMTGMPSTLDNWLDGAPELGLQPVASGSIISDADLQAYLKATTYFKENPRNFAHCQASVAQGASLLPMA